MSSISTSGKRAIDELPKVSPRPVEMQVLSLGLSRTATMSMHAALTMLGYPTYHMMEVGQRHLPNETHVECWREAFVAKMYGRGKPYGRAEFDILLRNYSAVTDAPCCCFDDELVEAYPEAKVILSTRDPDKWLASMETAYFAILTAPSFKWFRAICALDTELLWPYIDLLKMPLRYWTNDDWEDRQKLRQAFINHNEHVRKLVPKENLLEWVPADGWEPLCKFLGKPVPKEPFPNINKGTSAADMHKPIATIRALILLIPVFKWTALSGVVAAGAWWYARRS